MEDRLVNDVLTYNEWLLCSELRPQADVRLFCFPYAGGNAQIYRNWSKQINENVEVVAVNLPGHGNRIMEPPISRLDILIRKTVEAIYSYLVEKPFVFFGHSMGALISFEIMRYIFSEYGLKPEHLFVSAYRAPQLNTKITQPKNMHLSDTELIEELKEMNGTPEWVFENDEVMQIFLPVIRADMEVCKTYLYSDEFPINVPITAFGGNKDKRVSLSEVEKWKEQTAKFKMEVIQGDHFFIHDMETKITSNINDELRNLCHVGGKLQ